MSDELKDGKGFKVTDRRIRFDDDGAAEDSARATPECQTADATPAGRPDGQEAGTQGGDRVVEGPGWQMEKKPDRPDAQKSLPPMDFTQLCLSLASSALIHLGEANDPETGAPSIDLGMAKQSIDVLAMLEEKTRGNLTDAEQKLLSTVLYDLRMRFIQKSGATPR